MLKIVKDYFLRNVRVPLYGSIYIQSCRSKQEGDISLGAGKTRGLCNLFPRVFPAEVRTRVGSEAPANPHRKPTGLSGPGSLRHQHFGNNLMPGYIITQRET
jgi:hypothetical protein